MQRLSPQFAMPRGRGLRADTATDGRTTLLLTGFGPFPSVPVNATMMLVPRVAVAARRIFPAVRIVSDILPTEWVAAPALVDELLAAHQPDIVLHFGVSGRARGFEIETRGRNLRAIAPDAGGTCPSDAAVRLDGTLLLPSRMPVAEIVRRLRHLRLPAYRSWNAGAYLCNATLYHALTQTRGQPTQVGFVHIPDLLAPSGPLRLSTGHLRSGPGCPLSWPQALIGSLEIIAALLGQPSPNAGRRLPTRPQRVR